MTEYDFTQIASEVAMRENIKDCKIVHKYSTNKGDGYMGSVKAVQLQGSNKTLDVVFKYAHRNPKTYQVVPLREAYLNEINFYKVIAPSFTNFQKEHDVHDGFDNTAKFYGCVTDPQNELLVLENLRVDNYDLWNRLQTMNQPHLELALKTFAKFHGTSLAMKTLAAKTFNDLANSIGGNMLATFFDRMNVYTQVRDFINKLLHVFPNTPEHRKYLTSITKFASELEQQIAEVFNYHDNDVILQGDCWCNNAMYQYANLDDRSAPINMKLLDFQIVYCGSPVLDISYFFYSIAPTEFLDNLEYFLKIYHSELGKHLGKFQLDVDDVYSFEMFLKDWKKTSKLGLAVSILVRKGLLVEGDAAPNVTDNTEDFFNSMKIDSEKEEIYQRQIKEIMMHFVDRGFI